jgi:hypothetical protein
MSKSPIQEPNCLKIAEASVVAKLSENSWSKRCCNIVFNGVLCEVRNFVVTVRNNHSLRFLGIAFYKPAYRPLMNDVTVSYCRSAWIMYQKHYLSCTCVILRTNKVGQINFHII